MKTMNELPENIKGTPERLEFLKSVIQKAYDHENWYGRDRAWYHKEIQAIAARLELIELNVNFEPSYTPAI